MFPSKDEEQISRPIYTIYANESPKTIAYIIQRSATFSTPMKRSVRPRFILLLLIVIAATFGCGSNRVWIGFGDGDVRTSFWGFGFKENLPVDFPLFNSTLLKLAEIELGEGKLMREIERLLDGKLYNPGRFRTFAMWRKMFFDDGGDNRARMPRGILVDLRSPEFAGVWEDFRLSLSDWVSKKRFQVQPGIMDELLDRVKVPIDRHNDVLMGSKRKYTSCAVVGNSGILLSKEFGVLIDSHEAVIRLNNARVDPYQNNVGSKTSISFVNSNILHLCTRREDCFCHPYGRTVPIVMYMCQPAQFLDYVMCNSTHKAPLIVTDPRFDMLCARIVRYYSLKRFVDGDKNKTLDQWNSAHDGSLFHYSSGMQAVMLALGVCDHVGLFGFGKSDASKHHYHTNQKKELSLHDYEAEYNFYHDLVNKPRAVPFFSETFKFPRVVIHR